MERIVREILEFQPTEASDCDKSRLCADITGLALSMLDDKGIYNIPRDAEINYAYIQSSGSYGTHGITLDNSVFCFDEFYIDDILTLAHETCHLAQDHYKDTSLIVQIGKRFSFNESYFEILLSRIIADAGINISFNDSRFEMLYNYLRSYYYLQSFELDANEFAIEFLNNVLSYASNLDLSDEEKSSLQLCREELNRFTANFKSMINNMKNLRSDPEIQKIVQIYVRNARESCKKTCLENLSEMQDNELMEFDRTNIQFLLQSLQINYDDELAHRLMDVLYYSNSGEFKINTMIKLFVYTNINLTEDELLKMENLLKIFNVLNGKDIAFEDLLREKNRIASEVFQIEKCKNM